MTVKWMSDDRQSWPILPRVKADKRMCGSADIAMPIGDFLLVIICNLGKALQILKLESLGQPVVKI